MSRHYNDYNAYRPYRFPYRRSYGLIALILFVLIMSWEAQRIDASMTAGDIPQESIRLRILANSDNPVDQLVKRIVRDEIVNAMNGWITGPATLEEARSVVQTHMSEIDRIVADVLESRGFDYGHDSELGLVRFPTKVYGSKVYPADDYEALLITLGEGKGENWWCVLFPPLCFIDATTSQTSASTLAVVDTNDKTNGSGQAAKEEAGSDGKLLANDKASDNGPSSKAGATAENENADAPEVKFFLWELIQSLIGWFKSLF